MTKLGTMNFTDPDVVECPFAYYAAARNEAPVYKLNDFVPGRDVYLVTPYALVQEVLRDWRTYSNKFASLMTGKGGADLEIAAIRKQGFKAVDTMLTQDPPAQKQYRAIVNKAFNARRVNAMEDYVRQICNERIDGFAAKGHCDFLADFAIPLPVYVIADQLGVPRADLEKFKRWSDDVIVGLSQMAGREGDLQAARSVVELQNYFAVIVEARRAEPKDDIISDIANTEFIANTELGGERLLSMPECLSIIQQLLVAGNETTTNSLAGGMAYIVEQPGMAEKLARDPSLIPNAVEEILRLEAPTKHMWRIVAKDTELGGVSLPEGAVLLLSYDSANRDPAVFPNGETCDFARENAAIHLSFGQGTHFCVGALLARKEMTIAFECLLTRLSGWRLTPGENDLKHIVSVLHRGLNKLHLDFDAVAG